MHQSIRKNRLIEIKKIKIILADFARHYQILSEQRYKGINKNINIFKLYGSIFSLNNSVGVNLNFNKMVKLYK